MTKKEILGSTPEGKDWCLKALHPSDPLSEVRGIPDESAVPSMFMNFQTVTTLKPDPNAVGTWRCDGQLIPHPIAFGAVSVTDSIGTRGSEVLNTQLAGVDHSAKFDSLQQSFTRWRLAYASVTIYQDGPDLANQGTVVVCQKPVEPARFNIDSTTTAYPTAYGFPHFFHLNAKDKPDFDASQAMPNAYFGRSREGAYIPLKLIRTHQTWHSLRDAMYQCDFCADLDYGPTEYLAGRAGRVMIPTSDVLLTPGGYPFLSLNDLHFYLTDDRLSGCVTSDFCNENWADFSFRNMAVTTSLSFFWRFGFECQVQPKSILSPHLKLSPSSDKLALESYFAIARELKDAYPADFNDLGKIWDVISGIAKKIAPALSMIPVAGPMLSAAVPMVAEIGDRIRGAASGSARRMDGPTLGNTASAADVESARTAAQQVAMPTPRVVRVPAALRPRRKRKTVKLRK